MDAVGGIGFDLDHTLAIDNRLERVAFLRLLDIVLARGGHTAGTLADEIDAIDRLLQRQRSGDFTIDDAVAHFVTQHGVESSDWFAETFRHTAVDMVDAFVIPLPGLKQTMDALKERGILVAVLTNGWNPLQERKTLRAGFSGPILVSSEIGERKPSLGAFDRLLRTLGAAPGNTWYVGDDPHGDVAGAREAGMQTVWMNWERLEYPAGLPPPHYTIRSLSELVDLVPAIRRAS